MLNATPARAQGRGIVFEACENFRDLGGYVNSDGRVLKAGVLYRSGSLACLTDKDLTQLSALKIGAVIDLRSVGEIKVSPDRLPLSSSVIYQPCPIFDTDEPPEDADPARRERFYQLWDLCCHPTLDKYVRHYESLVTTHSDSFAAFMHKAAQVCEQPLLFHCVAGQDRTGVAAVFILLALGIARKDAIAEYMSIALTLPAPESSSDLSSFYYQDTERPEPAWKPGAQREYIEAALRKIDELFGGFDAYRRHPAGLKLSDQEVEKLRSAWLR